MRLITHDLAARGSDKGRLPSHIQSLDGLRAIAAIAVIVEHVYQNRSWIEAVLPGYFGVRLFFVLSGFLITSILLTGRGAANAGSFLVAFYARRSLRIFPIYYLALGVTAVLSVWIHGLQGHYWWRIFYANNFHMAFHATQDVYYGHLWSLAVEEQFYLVWPMLILFVPRRFLLYAILATVLIGPVSRELTARLHGSDLWIRKPTWACADSLGAGALSAYLRLKSKTLGNRWIVIAFVGASVAAFGLTARHFYGEQNSASAIFLGLGDSVLFSALVSRCSENRSSRWERALSIRPLAHVGKISYGIYLYHAFLMPVVYVVLSKALGTGYRATAWLNLDFVVLLLISIGTAECSWRFVEFPINSLKRSFPYTRRYSKAQSAGGLTSPSATV